MSKHKNSFLFWTGILLPSFFFLLITPWAAALDITFSQQFYLNGSFSSHLFWDNVYEYGIWPAWFIIGGALIGFCLSFRHTFRNWRIPCLYLILTLAIGSGLVIHLMLKENWGRPRPKQVIQFGGMQPFRPYYQPALTTHPEPSKSFSCGHCSMGFYFFAVALLGKFWHSRALFWSGLGLSFILGGLLSLARIAQGGHFFSDTIASALIMWLTAWILAYFLLFRVTLRNKEV